MKRTIQLAALSALVLPGMARACSLCGPALMQAPTVRQDAALPTARIIVIGTAHDRPGSTASEVRVKEVLRSDPALGGKKVIPLDRYVPSDPKKPPRFLVFCDIFEEKLDPFRGFPLGSDDAVDYAKKAIALGSRPAEDLLAFYFRYLDHPDKDVARDAFIEFARASDQDLARAARRLDPDKLVRWLKDPKTPSERLNIYALLLGASGRPADAPFLASLLDETSERATAACDGALAGYMHLRPREGWERVFALLSDGKKSLPLRLAAVRAVRYWHGAQPRESKTMVLKAMSAALAQGDLADLAVGSLQQWKMWDLTGEVLASYSNKGADTPIIHGAILRYALTCNDAACRAFIEERRKVEPDAVRDAEEQVRLDK